MNEYQKLTRAREITSKDASDSNESKGQTKIHSPRPKPICRRTGTVWFDNISELKMSAERVTFSNAQQRPSSTSSEILDVRNIL